MSIKTKNMGARLVAAAALATSALVPVTVAWADDAAGDTANGASNSIILAQASTDQDEQLLTFRPVVVSATRSEREAFTTPAAITVIPSSQIGLEQPYSYQQVFEGVPGVSILGGPRPLAQEPNIRGFSDEQVLIRVDGARQNFNQAHRGRFFTDPDLLKSVEVLRGPGGAAYGSGALGGVIQLETKDAADLLKPGATWGVRGKAGYQSNGEQASVSAAGFADMGMVDALINYAYRDISQDLKDGNGEDIIATQSTENNVIAKLGFDLAPGQRLEGSFSYFDDQGKNPAAANTVATGTNVVDRDTEYRSYKLSYEADLASPWVDFNALVYRNEANVDEDLLSSPRKDTTDYDTTGLEFTNTANLAPIGLVDPQVTVGFEWYEDKQSGTRNGALRPELPDAKATYLAGFIQAELEIADSVSLIPAVRYDDFSVRSETGYPDQDDDQFSPSVLLGWEANHNVYLWSGWSKAFRAPSLTEMYTSGTHFALGAPAVVFGGPPNAILASNQFVPNPDLKPEKANTIEAGVRLRGYDFLEDNDKAGLEVVGYYSKVDDYVETLVTMYDPSIPATSIPFPMGPFTEYVYGSTRSANTDAKLYGVEVTADYQADYVFGRVTGQYLKGEDTDGGPLGGVPANQIFVNVGGRLPSLNVEYGLTATFADEVDDVPAETIEGDGYSVYGLYAQWTPNQLANTIASGSTFTVGVDNLFGKTYRIYPNEINEPGTNFKLSLSVPL